MAGKSSLNSRIQDRLAGEIPGSTGAGVPMGHLKSLGAFLSDRDEDEIHKRVGHFTLIEVRRGKKNWSELINGALPIAVDRLLEFGGYLRDSYPLLSRPKRKKVKSYIKTLDTLKRILNRQSAADAPTPESRP